MFKDVEAYIWIDKPPWACIENVALFGDFCCNVASISHALYFVQPRGSELLEGCTKMIHKDIM